MRYTFILLFSFSLFAQTTPQEWFNTGATRYGSGDYAGALAAYEKARALRGGAGITSQNKARV